MRDVLREEKKFLLNQAEALKLRNYLSNVVHTDSHNGPDGYQVRSLYFDSLSNRDFQEKEDGLELRRKFRLWVYIFWTIIVGICCGVGDYLVAAVGSSAIFLIFLIMGAIRSDNRMLLIIRAKRSRCENIESQVFRYFGTGAVLRVKNTTEENAEYIYELSRKILEKVQKQHPALTDDFYNLGQIESVNIVAQSDEVYN